jgi:glycerophosphoryl diester phosphodiesterase
MNKLPDHLVIAHRGTTYWAPEETEAAMRWARNVGADYLELDLQRTKDGYLIALHDDSLLRTTNCKEVFPDRSDHPVSSFTYAELLQMDAGNWFNRSFPDRKRKAYTGLEILLLEDVASIALGKRIKRDFSGKRVFEIGLNGKLIPQYENDPADIGHRPGLYIETKIPALFPGIEKDLYQELIRLRWYGQQPKRLSTINIQTGLVEVAYSAYRVILQTFSKESLKTLNTLFDQYIPICFLMWRGDTDDDLPDDSIQTYTEWLSYGKENGASIVGPSISGEPNNYIDLLKPENMRSIKEMGMLIHAYSFDTWQQMYSYASTENTDKVNGMFTNRAEEAIAFYRKYYGRIAQQDPDAEAVLELLGYN